MEAGARGRRQSFAAAALAVVLGGLGWFTFDFWQNTPRWETAPVNLVVLLSDNEVAVPESGVCREQRMVITSATDATIDLRMEYLNDPAHGVKFCAFGDCGWAPIGADGSDIDPDECRGPMLVSEPIGDRQIRVSCGNGCIAEVLDYRS